MNRSDLHQAGALRSSTRALIILMLTVAMFTVNAFAPASATEEGGGDGDIESVRATVTETYNYKIALLTERKNGTENADKRAILAEGIEELTGIRNSRVATEDSIDELWALKERAHAIYNETISRAEQAGMTDGEHLAKAQNAARETVEYKISLLNKWIEGCDDPRAREIVADGIDQLRALIAKIDAAENADVAYALKDKAHAIYHSTIDRAESAKEADDVPTKEEKAAEELKNTRWSTLSLIERKTAILLAAADAAGNRVVAEIFIAAADKVSELEGAARSAKNTGALKEINANVLAIYSDARDAAAVLRGNEEADDHDRDPARRIEDHLGKVARHVDYLTELASATANDSPETYEAVVAANEKVHKAINSAMDVAESGKKLDSRWEDLSHAVRSFKRAFVAHYVSIANDPFCIDGLQIPG